MEGYAACISRCPAWHLCEPPSADILLRGWTRNTSTTRPSLAQPVKPAWHFSIVALVRSEIQAIDQHWSLHQLALAWPGGESDDALASEIAFLGDEAPPQGIFWPTPEPSALGALIERHLRQHIACPLCRATRSRRRRTFAPPQRPDPPSRNFRRTLSGCPPLDRRTRMANTRSLDGGSRNARGTMELRAAPAPVDAAGRCGLRLINRPGIQEQASSQKESDTGLR